MAHPVLTLAVACLAPLVVEGARAAAVLAVQRMLGGGEQEQPAFEEKLDGYEAFRHAEGAKARVLLSVLRGGKVPLGVDEAAAMLGTADAVLEFVATEERIHAFLLTRDGNGASRVRHRALAMGRKDLAERVSAFRGQLADRDPAFRGPARQLFDALLGSLAPALERCGRLLIVPDGPLWEMPFQALLTDRGRYLLEDHAIHYAPSVTLLGQLIARRSRASATRLLAVGNPARPRPSARAQPSAFRHAKLAPLPDAEREAQALARLYQPQVEAALYVGRAAQEKRIKAEVGQYGVLHFATHGILDERSPWRSHILLSPPARPEAPAEDDGILEAREILDLHLHAQLVVLSACEMARGRYAPGEGLVGMSWALFAAGASAAVLAQWKVDSASTTTLMIDFHRGLLGGQRAERLPKSEALRRAALGLLRSPRYRHPFYWAGFAVIGDDAPLAR